MSTTSVKSIREWHLPVLIGFLVMTLGTGLLGGLIGGSEGYTSLIPPPLAPPAAVFPIVWTILYVLMSVAAWLVWIADAVERATVLRYYLIQLLINAAWPLLFFRLSWRLLSFFWILLLIAVFSITMMGFRFLSTPAYWLLFPTLIWLLFAAYLNLGFYLLNT